LSGEKRLIGIGASAPAELRELAASVRRLIDRMLRMDDAAELLRDARERVDAVTARLEPHARGQVPRLGLPDEAEDARPYYVDGVMLPDHHPHAIATEMALGEDGVTRGTVNFGVTFEGPPGCVHGGVVASFFDQILGHHNLASGIPAMTRTLTIHYHRPTPLYTELRFEVRVRAAEGRKITTAGTLHAGDELVAEAEGLFILPGKTVFEGVIPGLGGARS
jgi:acyl-coenzyme A thioesterase PaaI-like protein